MNRGATKRERLSIDVPTEVHRKIKAYAALNDKTIREYVLELLKERLRLEEDLSQLTAMTTNFGPVFEELWNNEKDASYFNS